MAEFELPLRSIHHIELWVGNAKQSAYFLRHAFGFSCTAYAGPETGLREQVSYVLEQGKITLVVTGALTSSSKVAQFVRNHGDGVRDIALMTSDVTSCFSNAVSRGATAIQAPETLSDENGLVQRATIATYGETQHSFIDPTKFTGCFLPGFEARSDHSEGTGLLQVDHVVGNVETGEMDKWSSWYQDVLGFDQFVSFDDKDISTEYTALRSKVMSSHNRAVKFPINEPAAGLRRSQIQEYLDYNEGAGVQHIAMLTGDIIVTIERLSRSGVEFLDIPDTYYDTLGDRSDGIREDINQLRRLGILIDRDEHGYLLQIFTKPIVDRPTLFIEIIQRHGSQSFGKGNFRALFEAIEREQARRGNL